MTKAQKLDRQLALSYMSETSLLKRDLSDLGRLLERNQNSNTFAASEWQGMRDYYVAAQQANERRELFFRNFNVSVNV